MPNFILKTTSAELIFMTVSLFRRRSLRSVQFVIKTDPIEIPETEEAEEPEEEKLSFWRKLLNLFLN